MSILRGLKERYEVHHGVRLQDAALVSAAQLSHRYIADRFLPDKAIDLVDEAAAKLNIEVSIRDPKRRIDSSFLNLLARLAYFCVLNLLACVGHCSFLYLVACVGNCSVLNPVACDDTFFFFAPVDPLSRLLRML